MVFDLLQGALPMLIVLLKQKYEIHFHSEFFKFILRLSKFDFILLVFQKFVQSS